MATKNRRLCAVSVDLDEVIHYHRIFGLPDPAPEAPSGHAVYDVAIDRLESFADAHCLPLTWYAIGEDLARPSNAARLNSLCRKGHAIENHSFSHRYDLSRLPEKDILSDIEQGMFAIQKAVSVRPSGFRAPGYTISDDLLDALQELGMRFDSSVFPCPSYYSAKAFSMGLMRLMGKKSQAVLDTPRVLFAPMRPYRPAQHWYQRGLRSLIELPISVTPRGRLPVIGTSIGLLGPKGAQMLLRMCVRETFVNIELHGMDVLRVEDGLDALKHRSPELKTSLQRRLDALSAAISVLREAGFSFVRLDEAAEELRRVL